MNTAPEDLSEEPVPEEKHTNTKTNTLRRSTRKRRKISGEMTTLKSPVKKTRKSTYSSAAGGAQTPTNEEMETGPSPGTGASSENDRDASMKKLLLDMESRLGAKMDNVDLQVKANSLEIQNMKTSFRTELDERDKQLKKDLSKELEKQRKQTREEIDRAIAGIQGPITTTRLTSSQEEEYRTCRRSLRLFPIKGPNYAANVRTFLMTELKIPSETVVDMGNMEVKGSTDPLHKIPDEVLVVFKSRTARDLVKAAGASLAGRTGVGLRIHIPGFLKSNFNVLQGLAYNMKQSDAEIRRSIKFDDCKMDLFLDVRIDGTWRRITPEKAKEVVINDPDINIGPREMNTKDIQAFFKKNSKSSKSNSTGN